MKRYLPVSEGKRLNICVFACISTQKTVSLHDVNNKLKEEKRINKIKKRTAKNAQREREGKISKSKKNKGKSKFSSKYSDRIESIREADKKAENKMKQRKNKENKTRVKTNTKVRTTNARTRRKKIASRNTNQIKTSQEIREEMLKKLENSKLK